MEADRIKRDVLLDFDVLIGAYLTDEGQLPGIVLELVHLPIAGGAAPRVRTSGYVMTRAHAERIRNMLTKVLNQPRVRTLN